MRPCPRLRGLDDGVRGLVPRPRTPARPPDATGGRAGRRPPVVEQGGARRWSSREAPQRRPAVETPAPKSRPLPGTVPALPMVPGSRRRSLALAARPPETNGGRAGRRPGADRPSRPPHLRADRNPPRSPPCPQSRGLGVEAPAPESRPQPTWVTALPVVPGSRRRSLALAARPPNPTSRWSSREAPRRRPAVETPAPESRPSPEPATPSATVQR